MSLNLTVWKLFRAPRSKSFDPAAAFVVAGVLKTRARDDAPGGNGHHAAKIIGASRRGFVRFATGKPNPARVGEVVGHVHAIEANPFRAAPVGWRKQAHRPLRRFAPVGNFARLVPNADFPETLRARRRAACRRKESEWIDPKQLCRCPTNRLCSPQVPSATMRRESDKRFASGRARWNAASSSGAVGWRQCPTDYSRFSQRKFADGGGAQNHRAATEVRTTARREAF